MVKIKLLKRRTKTKDQINMSPSNSPASSMMHQTGRRSFGSLLYGAEWLLLGMVAAISLAGVVNAAISHQAVDWMSFFPAFGSSLALVAMGIFIRAKRDMPRMALGAIGFGVFMSFTGSIAIFIFTLFPLVHPLIDPQLMALDAGFGFSWLGFVELVANLPLTGTALRYVYLSILPQVVAVIILLSFLNRPVALHRFLTVGIVCMIVTVSFWWLLPSVGPAAYGMVSTAAQDSIALMANAAYGADMRRFALQGVEVITLGEIAGVIAFPSFHIVMTCMVLWFTRKTWAFGPLLAVDIAMPVATIVHGGHHLVDLFGGVAVFAACLWGVMRVLPDQRSA